MPHRPLASTAQGRTATAARQRVIELLLARGALSRAELARLTRLNKPTISGVVAGLIADGIVEEIGAGRSTGWLPFERCVAARIVAWTCWSISARSWG